MPMMVKFAETEDDFRRWDQFVLETPSGSFFVVSHWFDSYTSFGMKAKYLILCGGAGEIVGGAAVAIFKLGPMTWVQIPHGPVFVDADTEQIKMLVGAIENLARDAGAFLLDISPFEPSSESDLLRAEAESFKLDYHSDILSEANAGVSCYLEEHGYERASYVDVFRVPMQGQIVNLADDDLLMSFRKGTRRDIKYSIDSGVELIKAESIDSLRSVYEILKENSERKGYTIRPWSTFVKPLVPALREGSAIALMAKHESQLLSAAVVAFGGKRGAYLMGGTRRVKTERVFPAQFLQYQAMRETLARGYLQYDLTAIGAAGDGGVAVFKRGFRPGYYRLVGHYTKVFRPEMLRIFLFLQPWLTKNRRSIARFIARGKSMFARKRVGHY